MLSNSRTLLRSFINNFEKLHFSPYSTAVVNLNCNLRKKDNILQFNNNNSNNNNNFTKITYFHTQTKNYAARKGTRARKAKKIVKKEVIKKTFLDRLKEKLDSRISSVKNRPIVNEKLPVAIDDVYFYNKFQPKVWSFAEATQAHKENHHPTILNKPKVPLLLRINIDLVYPNRPNKFQEGWKGIAQMHTPFLLPGMVVPSLLVFCPNVENNEQVIADCIEAGADKAGSLEMIRQFQDGTIDPKDYEYIIAHPIIINDLTVIRGLLKRNFPSIKTNTLSNDLVATIKKIKRGYKYKLTTFSHEPDFGYIEVPIGTLDMNTEDLYRNYEAFILEAVSKRVAGKEPEDFIVSSVLKTEYSQEILNVDNSEIFAKVERKLDPKTLKKMKEEEKNKLEEEKEDLDDEEADVKKTKSKASA